MMAAQWDVIVVGAGIEGSATAYELAKAGQKTLLLEQFPLPHSRGSSHGHSRIIRKAYDEDFYARMMVDAFPMWNELEQQSKTTLIRPTGLLTVYKGQSSIVNSLKSIGSEYRELTGKQMTDEYPMLKFSEDYSGVYDYDGGVINADKALTAYQSEFLKLGGVIHDEEAVMRIDPGSPVSVHTSKGRYTSQKIVITAGPWTNKITEPLGLKLPLKAELIGVWFWRELQQQPSMPCLICNSSDGAIEVYALPPHEYPGLMKPVRVGVWFWRKTINSTIPCLIIVPGVTVDGTSMHVYSLPDIEYPDLIKMKLIGVYYWRDDTDVFSEANGFPAFSEFPPDLPSSVGVYAIPCFEHPGLCKVCLHNGIEMDPDDRDRVSEEEKNKYSAVISEYIKLHMPGLHPEPSISEACIYTLTPDENFILDAHPSHPNIIIGAGFSGHGFKLAPVVGRILTELVVEQSPLTYNISPFKISRFAKKIKSNL